MTKESSSRFARRATAVSAILVALASLLLFAWFLVWGPLGVVDLGFDETGALAIDSALCLLFFLQHSVMIRRSFRARLRSFVPGDYQGAVYAISSGVALLVLVLLWQEPGRVLFDPAGVYRWLPRILTVAAGVVFISATRALQYFDPIGVRPLLDRGEKNRPTAARLTTGGAYGWLRHPFYLAVLLLIWSQPTLTTDRLLLNVTWTVWIVVGSILEERDLMAVFGEEYRDYRQRVPMLLPLRPSRDERR